MAKKKTPTDKAITKVVAKEEALIDSLTADTIAELQAAVENYAIRLEAMLKEALKDPSKLPSLIEAVELAEQIPEVLIDAGMGDVARSYASRFRRVEQAAMRSFGVFTARDLKRVLDKDSLRALSRFQEADFLDLVDAKMVKPIKDAVIQNIVGGGDKKSIYDDIMTVVKERGIVTRAEKPFTDYQVETLVDDSFRRHSRTVKAEAAEELDMPIVWFQGPDDAVTSPQCRALLSSGRHGVPNMYYREEFTTDIHPKLKEDPLVAGGHWGCFLPGTRIYGKIIRASKSRYSGEAITIHTRKGHRLSVTPNHPILTTNGFVPAASLSQGDNVVSYSRDIQLSVTPTLVGSFHEYNGPALIEDVFETIMAKGTLLPLHSPSTLDLHGDAQPWNGDIHIVEMNRVLPFDVKPLGFKSTGEEVLSRENSDSLLPSSQGPLDLTLHGSGASSTSLPGFSELTPHQGGVGPDSIPLQPLTFGRGAFFDAVFSEYSLNNVLTDAVLALKLHDGFPTEILFDEVVSVGRYPFSGHVYDVESEPGWIIAEGVYTSNCRHTIGFVTEAFAKTKGFMPDRGRDANEEKEED